MRHALAQRPAGKPKYSSSCCTSTSDRFQAFIPRVSDGIRTRDILIHSQDVESENQPENQQFSASIDPVYRPVYRENSPAPKNVVDLDALPPHIRAAVQ